MQIVDTSAKMTMTMKSTIPKSKKRKNHLLGSQRIA